ncbi:unnamed protein product [Rotaria sp. Silwood1]|nr:unnamed protein product [Rotaria sp. Silwood1]CAF1030343.1 unnamed protein product [Rotaria sp. Silwood1]CAF3406729.1 unnamed protein product [Rotaria sp. Silwood1]CAF3424236.1 unnamed protein product [Rotaria sp. Silwood1]CAF3426531.1 unnamed protein product [Rotaria sp. Silwood1]
MSTTAYQSNHISTSFPRPNIRTSSTTNAMANGRSQIPLKANHFQNPIPPIPESSSKNSSKTRPSLTAESSTISHYHSNKNENTSIQSSKQIYTFSNRPREIGENRKSSHNNRLRQRISSAPDKNSPRSNLNRQKPSSANPSLTPRSHDDDNYHSIQKIRSTNYVLKRDEQQKDSLNDLIKKQEKSKVPKVVQRRRLFLLLRHSSPREKQSPSPISEKNQIETRESPIIRTNNQSQILPKNSPIPNSIETSQSPDNMEPEMVDSMQLAAILADLQFQDDWLPNEVSSENQSTKLDISKYEYVVASPIDTTTFKLSPRTIKPNEELAARIRFSQDYRYEMRTSANAPIPTLLASIVSDNNTIGGNGTDIEQTFRLKLNSKDTMKKQNSSDNDEPLESTTDNELVPLCYDATLKCFYDPNTGKYYELIST